jgi:hypothetical protein
VPFEHLYTGLRKKCFPAFAFLTGKAAGQIVDEAPRMTWPFKTGGRRFVVRLARWLKVVGIVSLVGAGLAFPLTAAAAPGSVGHTVTVTEHQNGSFDDPEATNPCTGEPGVAHFDGNLVNHVTYFPASDEVWSTFTETGKVSVTFGALTYTGHATAWGNFNLNERNQNQTFTLSIHASAPDGSSIIGHETAHFTLNANGEVTVEFDKISFDCA